MNEDCLKLTVYFAERDRADGRFMGDALLEICERHAFQTSVLLRGAEGFGTHQVLQTERLLSLSEDLPAVLAAVDARPRIEAALPDVAATAAHGLVTLERSRMLTGSIGEVALPEELHDATKLTVYCGRYERYGRRPAFVEIVDMLHRSGAIGANVLLGVDGTVHGARQRARFFGANARVPLMIIGVGRGDQMSRLLPDIAGLLERPLLTLERVRLCKAAGQRLDVPHQPTVTDETGMRTWVKVMVHAGQDAQHAGRPLYVELVRRLREAKAAGATVVQGIWGFQAGGAPQGDKLLALRRHVPTLTIVIDEPARIGGWFEIVDELTDEAGLVTSELVPALRARGTWGEAGGLRLAQKTG